MRVLVDISVVPLGVGLSLSPYIAECERIFQVAGLKTAMGVPRISTNMRLGTRTDREQTMEEKVRSVTEKL
jgi:uncharacterized protein YqgV (UPF0045/DUF77 family)